MRPWDSVSGHALDAVRAALELEDRVGAVALDLERVGAVGGLHRLRLVAQPLGVALVHAVEVAGPDAGLVAARAAADLDDHVLVVVGVPLDHREPDLLLQPLDARPRVLELGPHLRVLALGQQLLRALGVGDREPPLLGQLRGGRELVEGATGVGVALTVRDHLGIRHLRLRLAEAGFDLLDQGLDHRAPKLRPLLRLPHGRPRTRCAGPRPRARPRGRRSRPRPARRRAGGWSASAAACPAR